MNYERQQDLIKQELILKYPISLIGCGALGSASAMALAKMGVNYFDLWDEDGVNEVNLPNQMYRIVDQNKFKVEALREIIKGYNDDAIVVPNNKNYSNQALRLVVIVTTDSMSSRKIVWDQFLKQTEPRIFIEARMGAEEGQIYIIKKDQIGVSYADGKFYEDRLYSDAEAKQAPCTAKAIVYNVFMVASLVCRAYKAAINSEPFPREIVFGMAQLHKYSLQVRE